MCCHLVSVREHTPPASATRSRSAAAASSPLDFEDNGPGPKGPLQRVGAQDEVVDNGLPYGVGHETNTPLSADRAPRPLTAFPKLCPIGRPAARRRAPDCVQRRRTARSFWECPSFAVRRARHQCEATRADLHGRTIEALSSQLPGPVPRGARHHAPTPKVLQKWGRVCQPGPPNRQNTVPAGPCGVGGPWWWSRWGSCRRSRCGRPRR
jgi:hypothetical protein